jgi:hypothetical protein
VPIDEAHKTGPSHLQCANSIGAPKHFAPIGKKHMIHEMYLVNYNTDTANSVRIAYWRREHCCADMLAQGSCLSFPDYPVFPAYLVVLAFRPLRLTIPLFCMSSRQSCLSYTWISMLFRIADVLCVSFPTIYQFFNHLGPSLHFYISLYKRVNLAWELQCTVYIFCKTVASCDHFI